MLWILILRKRNLSIPDENLKKSGFFNKLKKLFKRS